MTDEQIRAAIRNLGYSADLTDAEINEGIASTLRRVKFEYPLMVAGLFTTVADQQVYDLFNPVRHATTQQGLFPEGLWVYEVLGGAAGLGLDLSVFGIAPWFQGVALAPGLTYPYSFNTPGDWMIWDLNWSAYAHRFSTVSFEHTESRYGAPIRLSPVPQCAELALVRFTRFRTVAELQQEDEDWFFHYVEGSCCRTLANKFSLSAGTKVGEIADTGGTVKYWRDLAKETEAEAKALFDERSRVTLHSAMRT